MKINFIKIILLSSFLLMSCEDKSNNISLFLYDSKDTFITSLSESIKEEFNNFIEVKNIFDAQESQIIQNVQIVNTLEKGSDLLIVNVVDRLAASSIIEKSEINNTPVIFFNREPLSEDLKKAKNSYYVGTSPIKEGKLQGKLIDQTFGGYDNFINSKYDKNHDGILSTIIIKGSNGHQDSELRVENALSVLNSKGYLTNVLSTVYCDWSKEKAKNEFSNLYKEFKDNIELVISANDDMALGAIEYIKENEIYDPNMEFKDQYFPIFGIDATEVGKASISNKELTGTVINDSKAQAKAIRILAEFILKKDYNWNEFPYEFDDEKFIHLDPEIYVE